MKKLIHRATRLVSIYAGLYRELATSAFDLVPSRR